MTDKKDDEGVLRLSQILAIFSSERNRYGFIYMVQGLDAKGHLTWPTNSLGEKIYHSPLSCNTSPLPNIPYCHIPATTSYVSHDKRYVVLNSDHHCRELDDIDTTLHCQPIADSSSLIISLFEMGIHKYFTYDNKKRSSTKTSKKRNATEMNEKCKVTGTVFEDNVSKTINPNAIPTITMGYSMNDTNEYKSNHSTVAGTVKPFMRNGGLPKTMSRTVVDIIELVISILPKENCFNIDLINNEYGERDIRKRMIADLKEFLGGDRSIENFRVEGIAILIPLAIGYHRDTLNCHVEGMETVVSVNARIPINELTLPTNHTTILRKWLEKNGYKDWFPCSIILYSRSSVGAYVNKLAMTNKISNECALRKGVSWALINRVGTTVDYLSRIFESDSFVLEFKRKAKKSKNSVFSGRMMKLTASYNRYVSHTSLYIASDY